MDTEMEMAMREMNRLTEKEVRSIKPDKGKFVKRLLDGGGLILQATESAKGVNWNWVFRYELDGERHDLGLGPLHTVSLAEARRRAGELRLQILDGIDPMQERADTKAERLATKAEKLKATTFMTCADTYFRISQHKLVERQAPQAMALDHAGLCLSCHRQSERGRY